MFGGRCISAVLRRDETPIWSGDVDVEIKGQQVARRVDIDARDMVGLLLSDCINEIRNLTSVVSSFLGAKTTRRTGRKKRKGTPRA